MRDKDQSCLNCYFFLHSDTRPDGQQIGYCRANPPTPYYELKADGGRAPKIARFPLVLGHMWCGAWDFRDGATGTEAHK